MSEKIKLSPVLAEISIFEGLVFITVVFCVAGALGWLVDRHLLPVMNRIIDRTETQWDDKLERRGVFRQLAYLVPALFIYFAVASYLSIVEVELQTVWQFFLRIILAVILVILVIIHLRLLSAGLDIYQLYPVSKERPITAYVQLAKLLIIVIGAITVVAVLINKSPWAILISLGGLAALAILIFRDTILSFVATIQLYVDDLVRPGDWIEVPECGADGDVIAITLNTVKVRNFDKTIVTVPTSELVNASFKNWRGMRETGGRRIKRGLLIDQTSVRFCDDEMMEKFRRIRLLKPYLEAKEKAVKRTNSRLSGGEDDQQPINRRTLTNLGTFRAYVEAYLEENKNVRGDLTVMVRQLAPTSEGIPLEVYSFAGDTDLVKYEGIQADIFDHLLAAVPFFELRVFQNPTGRDLHMLQQRSKAANPPDGVLP